MNKVFHSLLVMVLVTCITNSAVWAQQDNTIAAFSLSGYIESYYSYDINEPSDHNRPGFMYSHQRHNEVSLNLGLLRGAYQTQKVRGSIALATGSYMNANYGAEPGVLQNIYEAYVGLRLSDSLNIWVDAGIMPSHIGFESAIGKDNWTVTRGLYAENSPYFETGVKLSYTTEDQQWMISGLLLNGWQRIQRTDGNQRLALGHQLLYKPNSNITLNSSSYIGSDGPDGSAAIRYFHNLYGIARVSNELGITAGIDVGAEQNSVASTDNKFWYTPVILIHYRPELTHRFTIRVEYFNDVNEAIISTGAGNGARVVGSSANYDYVISDNALWRIEGRGLWDEDDIFIRDGVPVKYNYFITTSIALSF